MKSSHRAAAALAGAFAMLSGAAAANTGRIEFVVGNVTLQRGGAAPAPVARGAEVATGDTLRTDGGIVQIRYSDGSMVSLRGESEYTIENYRFSGQTDGSERGLFRLAKGTMRTVTGLVGRVTRSAYALSTPTATIGIRGTGGLIDVDPRTGATTLFGTSGTWDMRSQSGPSIPVGQGQTGRTTSSDQPAEQAGGTAAPPTISPAHTQPGETYSSAEDRTSTGQSVVASASSGGAGLVATFVGKVGANSIAFTEVDFSFPNLYEVSASVGAAGLASWTSKSTIPTSVDFTSTSRVIGGTLAEGGNYGPYSWGRIVNATVEQVYAHAGQTFTENRYIGPNGGLYFAAGPATVDMPKSGSFRYELVPGIQMRPSFLSEASISGALTSGQLTGTFTPTGGSIAASLGLTVNSQAYAVSGSGAITANTFFVQGTATGSGCSSTCFSMVQGGFAGAGASHAAAGYFIFLPSDAIGGLAIFEKK